MLLKLTLPAYSAADDTVLTTPAALQLINTRNVEPIGYWYNLAAATAYDIGTGHYYGTKKVAVEKEADVDREFSRHLIPEPNKFLKLTDADFEVDWYELLKLPEGDLSTENEIRLAYRKRTLETHPDKQPDRSDLLFKKVQRAFEILGSSVGRRAYDSSRPFDDSIPEDAKQMDDETFFKSFGPVFDRNRKWSVDGKMPRLGDNDTPIKEVNRIYDCWYRFNSWRDYTHAAELEKIDENMSREEKRYHQKENTRILDRLKRADNKRLRTLVERAQKLDPRLRRHREAEVAAKEKERLDRQAEKDRVRNEEIARKAAIAAKEKAEKLAKEEAEKAARNSIKVCQDALFNFLKENNLIEDVETNLFKKDCVRPPNVSWLYSKIWNSEEAQATLAEVKDESVAKLEDGTVPAVTTFNELVVMKEQLLGMSRYGEPMKRVTPEDMAERKRVIAEKKAAAKAAAATA